MSAAIRFIDAATAARLLDLPSLIEALRAGHRAGRAAIGHLLLQQPSAQGGTDGLLAHMGWQPGQALGVKLVTIFPDNAGTPTPTIASVYVLFDGRAGTPLAVIDGTPLTVRKTGADSALAADYLARRDGTTLLMMGAGEQAPWMIAAHRVARPGIKRILVWNRSAAGAEALAARLRGDGLDATAVSDPQAATGEADIISCATAARGPILHGAWLRPGTHVDLVGSFTPEMRETDNEVMRRGRVFVDTRANTLDHVGDLVAPIRDGVIGADHVLGDLYQLASGEVPGRQSDDEITVFKNGGGGHLDLMVARLVYERAQ
jgi:ornithine cyclodeaminase/alanine dehydrogenase-like protein (mu-crystallin family)